MRKRLQLGRAAMHSAAVLCSVYFVWFFIREDPKDALRKSFPVSCKSNQLYDTYKHGDSVDKIVNPACICVPQAGGKPRNERKADQKGRNCWPEPSCIVATIIPISGRFFNAACRTLPKE